MHTPPNYYFIIKKMNNCKHLEIEYPEVGTPIGHCRFNSNSTQYIDNATAIKNAYEKKYESSYLINGECMFYMRGCPMKGCPFYE